MLAQRPVLEAAGVTFEVITNHETLWTIGPKSIHASWGESKNV